MKNRALLRSSSISGLGGVLASFLFINENQVGLEIDSQSDGFAFSWMKMKAKHAQERRRVSKHWFLPSLG